MAVAWKQGLADYTDIDRPLQFCRIRPSRESRDHSEKTVKSQWCLQIWSRGRNWRRRLWDFRRKFEKAMSRGFEGRWDAPRRFSSGASMMSHVIDVYIWMCSFDTDRNLVYEVKAKIAESMQNSTDSKSLSKRLWLMLAKRFSEVYRFLPATHDMERLSPNMKVPCAGSGLQ